MRLAAKLVGWHIDIRTREEAARAAAAQLEALLAGGEATWTIRRQPSHSIRSLPSVERPGIETIEQLTTITVDELVDAIDVSFDQQTRFSTELTVCLLKSMRVKPRKLAR